jgi:single-strand DNA-binding protein
VIVEVRPAGEPARTSCSAQGLPSPELDPARCRWESPFIERRSGVVRKERSQEHKEQDHEQHDHHHGNLTREPEIRYTKEGQATTQLGVAVNRRWQDRTTQEWQEATSFFDVVCWRDLAENVALSLSKGMRVVVTGRIEQRSWETDDGEHRSKVEIVADEIGPSLRFATADVQRTARRQGVTEGAMVVASASRSCGTRASRRGGQAVISLRRMTSGRAIAT